MTDARPPFIRSDIAPTAGRFLLGIVISFGLVGAALILLGGFWILWPFILATVVLQLMVQGGIHLIWSGLRRGWSAVRGRTPPPPQSPPPARPPEPRLRAYALPLGLIIGAAVLPVPSWLRGDLPPIGGFQ